VRDTAVGTVCRCRAARRDLPAQIYDNCSRVYVPGEGIFEASRPFSSVMLDTPPSLKARSVFHVKNTPSSATIWQPLQPGEQPAEAEEENSNGVRICRDAKRVEAMAAPPYVWQRSTASRTRPYRKSRPFPCAAAFVSYCRGIEEGWRSPLPSCCRHAPAVCRKWCVLCPRHSRSRYQHKTNYTP